MSTQGATICLRGHTCPNVWPLPLLLLNPWPPGSAQAVYIIIQTGEHTNTQGRFDRWEMSATYLSKKTRPSNSTPMAEARAGGQQLWEGEKKKYLTQFLL